MENFLTPILGFEATHDSSQENLNLHPMNPWVASSEAVTPIHRLEHSSRRHDHFRNFDQESSQEQNRFLNSGGVPPNFIPHEQHQIFPTPQNGPPSKKFEEMFDVDFPAYPPRGVSDLFAGNPIRGIRIFF